MFANRVTFDNVLSRFQALGADTRPEKAIVNVRGKPLFYSQTGGMMNPMRHELQEGDTLFRFVARDTPIDRAVTGGWWVDESNFEKLCSFAQQQSTSIAMAARMLCCVPPEWSNMGMLVRAKVRQPLLAYRGLGKDVSIKMEDGLGNVNMTAHNHIAARRLHQLYIPGLYDVAQKSKGQVVPGALQPERTWALLDTDANKGWLYI